MNDSMESTYRILNYYIALIIKECSGDTEFNVQLLLWIFLTH